MFDKASSFSFFSFKFSGHMHMASLGQQVVLFSSCLTSYECRPSCSGPVLNFLFPS